MPYCDPGQSLRKLSSRSAGAVGREGALSGLPFETTLPGRVAMSSYHGERVTLCDSKYRSDLRGEAATPVEPEQIPTSDSPLPLL